MMSKAIDGGAVPIAPGKPIDGAAMPGAPAAPDGFAEAHRALLADRSIQTTSEFALRTTTFELAILTESRDDGDRGTGAARTGRKSIREEPPNWLILSLKLSIRSLDTIRIEKPICMIDLDTDSHACALGLVAYGRGIGAELKLRNSQGPRTGIVERVSGDRPVHLARVDHSP